MSSSEKPARKSKPEKAKSKSLLSPQRASTAAIAAVVKDDHSEEEQQHEKPPSPVETHTSLEEIVNDNSKEMQHANDRLNTTATTLLPPPVVNTQEQECVILWQKQEEQQAAAQQEDQLPEAAAVQQEDEAAVPVQLDQHQTAVQRQDQQTAVHQVPQQVQRQDQAEDDDDDPYPLQILLQEDPCHLQLHQDVHPIVQRPAPYSPAPSSLMSSNERETPVDDKSGRIVLLPPPIRTGSSKTANQHLDEDNDSLLHLQLPPSTTISFDTEIATDTDSLLPAMERISRLHQERLASHCASVADANATRDMSSGIGRQGTTAMIPTIRHLQQQLQQAFTVIEQLQHKVREQQQEKEIQEQQQQEQTQKQQAQKEKQQDEETPEQLLWHERHEAQQTVIAQLQARIDELQKGSSKQQPAEDTAILHDRIHSLEETLNAITAQHSEMEISFANAADTVEQGVQTDDQSSLDMTQRLVRIRDAAERAALVQEHRSQQSKLVQHFEQLLQQKQAEQDQQLQATRNELQQEYQQMLAKQKEQWQSEYTASMERFRRQQEMELERVSTVCLSFCALVLSCKTLTVLFSLSIAFSFIQSQIQLEYDRSSQVAEQVLQEAVSEATTTAQQLAREIKERKHYQLELQVLRQEFDKQKQNDKQDAAALVNSIQMECNALFERTTRSVVQKQSKNMNASATAEAKKKVIITPLSSPLTIDTAFSSSETTGSTSTTPKTATPVESTGTSSPEQNVWLSPTEMDQELARTEAMVADLMGMSV